jgi:DNA-binding transcriptional ArsR family regulator
MITKQKYQLYEKQAEVVQAVAHPLRIAILDFLADGSQCVCDIAEHIGSERSNVSRHLAVMFNAGLLEQRKEGLKVIYKVKTPCLFKFLSCVSGVLKEQIEDHKKLAKMFE